MPQAACKALAPRPMPSRHMSVSRSDAHGSIRGRQNGSHIRVILVAVGTHVRCGSLTAADGAADRAAIPPTHRPRQPLVSAPNRRRHRLPQNTTVSCRHSRPAYLSRRPVRRHPHLLPKTPKSADHARRSCHLASHTLGRPPYPGASPDVAKSTQSPQAHILLPCP